MSRSQDLSSNQPKPLQTKLVNDSKHMPKNIPKRVELASYSTSSGTPVMKTTMLKGEAKRSAVESESNDTGSKYSCKSSPVSGAGGLNTNK